MQRKFGKFPLSFYQPDDVCDTIKCPMVNRSFSITEYNVLVVVVAANILITKLRTEENGNSYSLKLGIGQTVLCVINSVLKNLQIFHLTDIDFRGFEPRILLPYG
jgi:hypothetical protein